MSKNDRNEQKLLKRPKVSKYEEMTENFDATQEFPNENIEKLEVAQYEQNVNKWTQALVRRRLCKLSYNLQFDKFFLLNSIFKNVFDVKHFFFQKMSNFRFSYRGSLQRFLRTNGFRD